MFIHSIGINRSFVPTVREIDESVISFDEDNIVVVSHPKDDLSKFKVDDFDRKVLIKSGVPLDFKQCDSPSNIVESFVNRSIENFNLKMSNLNKQE